MLESCLLSSASLWMDHDLVWPVFRFRVAMDVTRFDSPVSF